LTAPQRGSREEDGQELDSEQVKEGKLQPTETKMVVTNRRRQEGAGILDSDDKGSTCEGVGEKMRSDFLLCRLQRRKRKTRHLNSVVYTSNSFVAIRDGQQNVVQAKCCIIGSKGKACGMTVEIFKSSPKAFWSHLEKHNKTEFFALQMAQVIMSLKTSFPVCT